MPDARPVPKAANPPPEAALTRIFELENAASDFADERVRSMNGTKNEGHHDEKHAVVES
jgi:hypothetical protein